MGRRCSVCHHSARETIEAAVLGGTSLAEAAALHPPLTKSALGRHMADHVAPVRCDAVADPSDPLAAPPMVRLRERPVKPVSPDDLAFPAGNVVPFRGAAPIPDAPDIAAREAPDLKTVAILALNGYSPSQIAKRFELDDAAMRTLLADVEEAYVHQATGFSPVAVIGRQFIRSEYAIAELERLYQAAAQAGRNREARECRRDILAECREQRAMLREYGITRPLHPDELYSDDAGRKGANDILRMVENTIRGLDVDAGMEPAPPRKPRLIG